MGKNSSLRPYEIALTEELKANYHLLCLRFSNGALDKFQYDRSSGCKWKFYRVACIIILLKPWISKTDDVFERFNNKSFNRRCRSNPSLIFKGVRPSHVAWWDSHHENEHEMEEIILSTEDGEVILYNLPIYMARWNSIVISCQ